MKDFNYLYAMTQFIFQRDDAISCMVNGLQVCHELFRVVLSLFVVISIKMFFLENIHKLS